MSKKEVLFSIIFGLVVGIVVLVCLLSLQKKCVRKGIVAEIGGCTQYRCAVKTESGAFIGERGQFVIGQEICEMWEY